MQTLDYSPYPPLAGQWPLHLQHKIENGRLKASLGIIKPPRFLNDQWLAQKQGPNATISQEHESAADSPLWLIDDCRRSH
ncbi:hypothetical protein O9K51_00965 [Purpureocillium lavendulum]|uniref:Uncharacterized protein n=1 Tax=Purpureocillium lavendulum TaxID=1247861 RepID=A0AB34G4X5_9HYPO|nr:hypothetical protein O9K51_00965 [Purpureocillium lavendulum]